MTLDYLLVGITLLILLSIGFAKLFDNLGLPTLVLFIALGMLAGSEGIGGIYFNDAKLAQSIGIIALIFILFSGGLDTSIESIRPIKFEALSLATIGVFLSAVIFGVAAAYLLKIELIYGLLLGSIISSTDAAAVFNVLRSKNVGLKQNLKSLLEFESGSNDPMAIFLTLGIIELISIPGSDYLSTISLFFRQFGIGGLLGLILGRVIVFTLNKINFSYEGIYPVLFLAFAGLVYGATNILGGSGFLAVYLAGISIGNRDFIHKKSLIRFFDGLAWLGQIGMFLTLGLLVFPSQLFAIIEIGLFLSIILMFFARPLSVYISLLFSKTSLKEKTFVSWVGLRGAVPIVLATFPMLAGVKYADLIFSIVFFIVLTSALLQGWSLTSVAKLLKLDLPLSKKVKSPIEFESTADSETDLYDFYMAENSGLVGKSIVEIGIPKDSLIVLIPKILK
ncbi:MAG: K+/H+ antiporter [Ignavibacteria bacterium RIFOXYB2_FULL_35_12]|nr:MAG: K+/H+ antiporter [Ignavibacteria bacterium GWF2_35_20]OGU84460.1 MAG: K+/H+ antiporter [Ignavibacteria bacterium RIFOXYA12_FULL_35_25]OGU95285.1 MAG: K+/H+ antiporter [Ignavibacteria bacterium RIFOXYB12_FULL_35_14]OGU98882.1 MAG: K+/H+ antiporter [Ignavibacteria bacterium RIFOXYC2_FULL_35_16]OGV02438.1 MAG: K+/H+ antiporter [Ignavibacteria bacterium RIFOXYB2_FULL_35_12]OGV30841.1 MAG: K+/H+ antiporter [Ignavibacteria bacterium RIFOXYD12_FULL_36_8]HAB52218.1 potassium/proton antiporter